MGWGWALVWGADPREIVRASVEKNAHNADASLNYRFLERQEVRELDRSGKIKSRKIETWDITPMEGSPYRRLVARDDLPLAAGEQQREEEKLRFSSDQRRQETPEQRKARVAAWQQREERQRAPLRDLPEAFNFTLHGEERLDGRAVWVIDANPRPGYRPRSTFTAFFPKVHLRLWIDEKDDQGAKVEMEALDTITFGGFLVRLAKGSHLMIEQTRVDEDVWLPERVSVVASARILLLKGFHRDFEYTFSNYRRSTAGPHAAAGGSVSAIVPE